MDAQNAAESAATKPPASSTFASSRPVNSTEPDQSNRYSASAPSVNKYPSASARASSPPVKESKPSVTASQPQAQHDDAGADNDGVDNDGADNDSEADTIVLTGKDGSPVKNRKLFTQEYSDRERRIHPQRRPLGGKSDGHGPREGSGGSNGLGIDAAIRKRPLDQPRSKDSSGLSSAPGSPPNRSRRRSVDAHPESESESVHAKPTKISSKEKELRDKDILKSRPTEKLVSHKRKAPKADSDDEADSENHKARRQRTSASIDASASHRSQHKDRDHIKLSSSKSNHEILSRHRSTSPHPRTHRRSASTQVVSQSSTGLSQKKKRVPPPLSTDYHSDESSASGSPHVRSSTLRSLATPATAESTMSSAPRNPAHKKHVDAHGQTPLAKACSRGEYEMVKRRLQERPEDLNHPDYAGNTPLQIAALNGYDDIVKLLLEAGCDIECVNYDKDTPLLDAVDNGHLNVIKVLLNAGVNPRKANVSGEEPIDRVDDELDNAEEIKAALIEARKNMGERRKTSEEHQDHQNTRSSRNPDSPRRSPAVIEMATSSRRAASSRSHKLSDRLLYTPLDEKSLRQAAGKGDVETVQHILQVRDNLDHAESLVAAARGGHDTIMNLLLALGNADPDPKAVPSMSPEIATPILAAIGQENIKVIRLLLDQSAFDPTRRFRGETYYQIAQKRQGTNWKEEEHMLKEAYDAYRKAHRDPSKKSPNRREQETKRSGRTESKDDARTLKRKPSSPARDGHRVATSKSRTSEKEPKAAGAGGTKDDALTSPKRGPGRPRKEDRGLPTIAISDGEDSPPASKPSNKQNRPDLDPAAMSSEGESKPRKRLVSAKEMKEQREKNRRASMVSNSSSLRDPSSPRDSRHDEPHELPTEKYHDRAKALKRDESRDRLSVTGENPGKRSRTSATPDQVFSEKEGEPSKRRRLDIDKKERLPKPGSSPDRNRKSAASRDATGSSKQDDKPARKHVDHAEKRDPVRYRKPDSALDSSRRESGKSTTSEKSIHVKAEDPDVAMRDADQAQDEEIKACAAREKDDDKKRRAELEAKRKEKEAEERRRRQQVEAKKREEEEKEKKRLEEEERKKLEDEARKKREEAERLQKEEERRRREEEERQKKRLEEEERKRREEEERIRKEQEAAEEARRKLEEEERKERERKEQERKEQERRERQLREERRVLREAEQRRAREELERIRLDKLPAFLRWLDRSPHAKTAEMARRWRILIGVRFDSICPDVAGTPEGREQWIMNTQAALLLGESDLQLTRFSGWKRIPASLAAKYVILGKRRPNCALINADEWDLGREIPGYYFGKEPEQLSFKEKRQLEEESKSKFLALDLFFVKLSDLMFAIPNIPHLRGLEVVVMYEEIPETVEKYDNGDLPSRWKDDPDATRYLGFCPRNKYFVNGQLVREGKVDITPISTTPWPEQRVPRNGLTAVPPTDPNYARLCKEQGLEHLLSGLRTPPMATGAQTSPNRLFSQRAFHGTDDGLSPPRSESNATANGEVHQPRSSTASTGDQDRPLTNGVTEPTAADDNTNANQ